MKRKRGRPRKHPRPDDDDDDDDDRLALQQQKQSLLQAELGLSGGALEGSQVVGGGMEEDTLKQQHASRKKHYDGEDGGDSSSENEFSYDEEEEDDDDDDEDGEHEEGSHDDDEEEEEEEEDEEEEDDDEDDHDDVEMRSEGGDAEHSRKAPSLGDNHAGLLQTSSSDSLMQKPKTPKNHPESTNTNDEELRKHRKLLKKKLKHSAANKIQNQWKKKKNIVRSEADGDADVEPSSSLVKSAAKDSSSAASASPGDDRDEHAAGAAATVVESTRASQEEPSPSGTAGNEEGAAPVIKKKKKNNGVVPPPSLEVLEWARNMSEKKCRKHVASGLRVKVRFATKVKRDGKKITKRKWYGGRVAAVSKKGSKIRIKYDDGTSEISKFPDKDVVVDSFMNGEHEIPADRFCPPEQNTELEPGQELQYDPEEDRKTTGPEPSPPSSAVPSKEESPKSFPTDEQTSAQASEVEVKASSVESRVSEGEQNKTEPNKEEVISESASKGLVTPAPTVRPKDSDVDPNLQQSDQLRQAQTSNARGPALLASPEEGELSPGITSNTRKETTSEVSAPTEHAEETKSGESMEDSAISKPNKCEGESSAAPKSKLAIRIPGRATLKGLASPKSTPVAGKEQSSIDDILVDTPQTEGKNKRNRTSDNDDVHDEPPKRRIKVSIEKASLEGAIEEKQETQEEPPVPENTSNESSKKEEPRNLSIRLKVPQQQVSESNNADLVTPHLVEKKKKKRARSPRPRSPVPKPQMLPSSASGEEAPDPASLEISQKPHIGSKHSAFTGKKSSAKTPSHETQEDALPDDDGSKHPVLMNQESFESNSSLSRVGRKAAQQAKEKLATKERDRDKDTLLESGKKKKKRRRADEVEAEGEEAGEVPNETEWVQCDSCGKWRILPDNVKVSSLPNLWYCRMNIYDPKRSSCDAPEQSAKQAMKERKRAKKRTKRLEAESQHEELKKEKQSITAPASSPRPVKSVKSGAKLKEQAEAKKKSVATLPEEPRHPSDASGSDTQKEEKKKGRKVKPQEVPVPEQQDAIENVTDVKKPGRKRGRPTRNQTSSASQPPSQKTEDEDNVEWVQCEKCEKWRKLPPDISADELPDTWYCSMNTWNPSSASCNAAEDKADAQHHEVGSSEWQLRQTQAGKYSYRQMIFGTGARKQNRPMSERARAAESLFIKPVSDDENPIPTTQYSKSSAFLPRTSNFNKSNPVDEKTLGIFDVLSNSTLWAELRAMEQCRPMKIESISDPGQTPVRYEYLPDHTKILIQQTVLQILGNRALPGDSVIIECQKYPWEDSGMENFCNADVVINALLGLVKDGVVEMTSSGDSKFPFSQWIPKYRRVKSRRALEAEEAIKASSMMKISKPWKHRDDNSAEWVSGEAAFN